MVRVVAEQGEATEGVRRPGMRRWSIHALDQACHPVTTAAVPILTSRCVDGHGTPPVQGGGNNQEEGGTGMRTCMMTCRIVFRRGCAALAVAAGLHATPTWTWTVRLPEERDAEREREGKYGTG